MSDEERNDPAGAAGDPPASDSASEPAPDSAPASDGAASDGAAADGAAADPLATVREAWGFPAFAEDFPPDAELAALVTAFADGDYKAVRERAPTLAASTKNSDVKRAAELLRARIEPDPSSRVFFGLTAALLVFLFAWWAAHDGPQHTAPASPKAPPVVEFVK
jgi:hypothetical protein